MKAKFEGARRGLTTSKILFLAYSSKARGMSLARSQKGLSLIEVLIAVAILGIVAVAFLTALATSSSALIIADERTTAESLTRSELEYVKSCSYEYGASPSYKQPVFESLTHRGYFISVEAVPIDPATGTALANPGDDEGIQKITVEIYRQDGPAPSSQDTLILSTSDYKVDR